jgi:hypothetical protein
MPVLSDKSTLNAQLVKWCQDNYPDCLKSIISKHWWRMIDHLQSIGDVWLAANLFLWFVQHEGRVGDKTAGNEALIDAIRKEALRRAIPRF